MTWYFAGYEPDESIIMLAFLNKVILVRSTRPTYDDLGIRSVSIRKAEFIPFVRERASSNIPRRHDH